MSRCSISGNECRTRLYRPHPWSSPLVGGVHHRPRNGCPHQSRGHDRPLGYPRIETKKVAPYILGQLAGASIAGFIQLALWTSSNSPRLVETAHTTFLGDTIPSPAFGIGAVLLAEVIGIAILVFTIVGATDNAAEPSRAGVTIGFALAAIVWMFGPISGASLNPARTWRPTLASAAFSLTPLGNLWIYIVGPVLGGLLGAFLYDVFR